MNALFALLVATTLLHPSPLPAAPGGKPKKPAADKVALLRVDKSEHRLDLVAEGGRVIKTYKVAIGSGGAGPKRFEGDKVTPVGTYRVKGRFKGLFHQFINVTYPNDVDRARFAELKRRGEVPPGRTVGFGIGIHGVGKREWNGVHKQSDWTHGCIALDDAEIDELSRLVPDDTTLVITD
ncbi:L,D-transpeptidase family protein [Polyangium spumosum]|uniref:L,D-transpeptidase family protein n=1 Tax=Polyangium spumosum TaxID=889282 RepID=A0A6N7Q5B2_9BACT|nr:L,D-transpeptidase family protein [Polyangium spumosum]MRG96031.1 L,D-transpeptidase family protein [Polyangium spumosum]